MAKPTEQGEVARRTKPVKQFLEDAAPWKPPVLDLADITAIQAVAEGKADPYQQGRAIKCIVEQICGTYEFHYRPGGLEGDRDTTFGLGRQFVGQQIVKATKLNLAALRRKEPNADQGEPQS